MSRKVVAFLSCVCLLAGLIGMPAFAADDDDAKPKYAIKDVMKKALKGPLLKKVASGEASEEETKELHKMLVDLGKNKPKKGDADSWKELTDALAKAGQAAVEGEVQAGAMLKKAADCKGCHSKHK